MHLARAQLEECLLCGFHSGGGGAAAAVATLLHALPCPAAAAPDAVHGACCPSAALPVLQMLLQMELMQQSNRADEAQVQLRFQASRCAALERALHSQGLSTEEISAAAAPGGTLGLTDSEDVEALAGEQVGGQAAAYVSSLHAHLVWCREWRCQWAWRGWLGSSRWAGCCRLDR